MKTVILDGLSSKRAFAAQQADLDRLEDLRRPGGGYYRGLEMKLQRVQALDGGLPLSESPALVG